MRWLAWLLRRRRVRDSGEMRHGDGSLCGIHPYSARCINDALRETM